MGVTAFALQVNIYCLISYTEKEIVCNQIPQRVYFFFNTTDFLALFSAVNEMISYGDKKKYMYMHTNIKLQIYLT